MKKYIDLEDFDNRLTVGELKIYVAQEEEIKKLKEKKEIESIKTEFENTYLKYIDNDSIFGKELVVIKLENLVKKERTTDWNLTYYFEGSKISFSDKFFNFRTFDVDRCGDSFSEKDLKEMEKISYEEYLVYKTKYESIESQIKDLFL